MWVIKIKKNSQQNIIGYEVGYFVCETWHCFENYYINTYFKADECLEDVVNRINFLNGGK